MESERALLRRAMAGVRIVPCGRCDAEGMIGLPSLRIPCVDCGGSHLTTTRLEMDRAAETDS